MLAITAITFLAVMGIAGALLYALMPADAGIARRLARVLAPSAPVQEDSFYDKQKARLSESLASLGKMLPAAPPVEKGKTSKAQLLMIRAGYRSPRAALVLGGLKIVLPLVFLVLVFTTGFYRLNPFIFPVIAAFVGYLLPEMVLVWKARSRQHRIQRGLADGLDLLVICVEAGLGLDQALLRVSQEIQITHPELSAELQLVNMEMRVGKTRIDALRELARRTGLEDIKALVAMLIQTERFGTSVAQSLRVHSDDLRTKRRQRAEEMSAKTTVKMVPPLVFFIFPALMVVILGPAVIALMRQLLPAFNK